MNFFKINFRCIFFKIQRKVTEQTAAEAAVEVVLQHMMQHVKNIFRRRQYRIGLTVKRKGRCFQMIRGENLVHQLIRTGKLIDADDAVVQLQREGTVRVRDENMFPAVSSYFPVYRNIWREPSTQSDGN